MVQRAGLAQRYEQEEVSERHTRGGTAMSEREYQAWLKDRRAKAAKKEERRRQRELLKQPAAQQASVALENTHGNDTATTAASI